MSKPYLSLSEHAEKSGSTYKPKETPLPPYCFGVLPSIGEIIKITRYEKGYTPLKAQPVGESQNIVQSL